MTASPSTQRPMSGGNLRASHLSGLRGLENKPLGFPFRGDGDPRRASDKAGGRDLGHMAYRGRRGVCANNIEGPEPSSDDASMRARVYVCIHIRVDGVYGCDSRRYCGWPAMVS